MGTRAAEERSVVACPEVSAEEVRSHLDQVLESQPFRSSQRSRDFLRHVVTLTLHSQTDLLRERQIGEALFGRPPDYDTGQDAIVRVKANEVRRRLAQYYDLHPGSPIRFELATGSYAIQFHRGAAIQAEVLAPPHTDPTAKSISGVRGKFVIAALGTVALTGLLLLAMRAPRPFDQFWAPFSTGSGPVLISIPHPEVYRIYGPERDRFVERFRPRPPDEPRSGTSAPVENVIIFPEHNLYVGIGDARSLALIHSLLLGFGRQPVIRRANETSFTELRAGASVLLGGFTNRWTLEFTRPMPFTFKTGGQWGIFEARSGRGICVKSPLWKPPDSVDCAIIARLMNTKSGKPLLIAAGLEHYGTFAVGEFLTRPELLGEALKKAPHGWTERNLEIVIQVEVVGDNVGPPKVLATEVW